MTVGQYSDPLSAGIVSKRLSEEGIPNRIYTPLRSSGECYIWVAPESVEAAKQILSQPAVPEEELTALAMKDPAPDDFVTTNSETRAHATRVQNPIARPSAAPVGWLLALLLIGVVVVLVAYLPRKSSGFEVARQRSPDGWAQATLMEVPEDAADAHSYKVCVQLGTSPQTRPGYCYREVAYLAGVPNDGGSRPVALVWTTASQLEIRYTSARSVHIYQPVLVWGSRYAPSASKPAIIVRAVQSGAQAPSSTAGDQR